jgi:hypothetical protein
MSESSSSSLSSLWTLQVAIGVGVQWHVWGAVGFWWGVLYGLFWEVWAGYHLAAFLLAQGGGR